MLTYQMFVEPKGKHLKAHDKWKEEFLREVKKKSKVKPLEFQIRDKNYTNQLIGVPFYNNEDENEFEQSLYEALEV